MSDTGSIYIPRDVLVEIHRRLPMKSLQRFKCVCQRWYSTILDIINDRRQQMRSITSLLIIHGNDNGDTTISLTNYKVDKKTVSEIDLPAPGRGAFLLSNSVNGLVCVYGKRRSYLINPKTEESILLPKYPEIQEKISFLGLGYDRGTGSYKILVVFESCICRALTVGTREWRYICHEFGNVYSRSAALFLHGSLHIIAYNYELNEYIRTISIRDEELGLIETPVTTSALTASSPSLIDLEGRLGYIRANPSNSTELSVWTLTDEREWEKAFNVDLDLLDRDLGELIYSTAMFDAKILISSHGNAMFSYDYEKDEFEPLECICKGFAPYVAYLESSVSPSSILS